MTPRCAAVRLLILALLPLVHAGEPPAPATPPVPTVIESGAAEMVSTEQETTFTFTQGVQVTATNMTMTCERLVVIATRAGDPSATLGNQQNFKSLIATGGVRIVQNDREAIAQRAEVFPGEDKVVLSGNPVIRSAKDGWEQRGEGQQLILYRGERRAVLQGPPGTRTQLILPPLKDLGYDPEKPKDAPAAGAPAGSAPKQEPPAGASSPSAPPAIRVPLPNLPR